ncbi:YbaB/EbfC family DNA-binding protein [Cupriavidus basilensis]|uniref:YbaB/EbfC family DNA-binding protein n=1 Tax=Cupriavidus basilensis TaxID=68895 RepID=A0ABT6ATK2_9BURK|nr:YbaB/EbfC family DNA-binding protein [Cupriavidus basilensis]MDF3835950.1 YbaB/EbfC family DNA-binding protein [Cupriavidus basilensis]
MPSPTESIPQSLTLAGQRAAIRRGWRGLLKALGAAGLGLTAAVSPATPASAQAATQTPAQPVPQHWIRYAQLASTQFQARLGDQTDETVLRLQGWMQDRMLHASRQYPPPPLTMRVWFAPTGRVERVEFASLGDPQADADLRALLAMRPLSEPPPPDMRQPIVLELALEFPVAG